MEVVLNADDEQYQVNIPSKISCEIASNQTLPD
jgi:hypothetical protein